MPDASDFDAIVANINVDEPDDVLDVTTLSRAELAQRYNAARRQLTELNEPVHPLTDRGRQLHSERGALRIELRKRGML